MSSRHVMPSMSGIWMSSRTRSGRSRATIGRTSAPLPAIPTTSMSSARSRARRTPSRVSGWSSATRILTVSSAVAALAPTRDYRFDQAPMQPSDGGPGFRRAPLGPLAPGRPPPSVRRAGFGRGRGLVVRLAVRRRRADADDHDVVAHGGREALREALSGRPIGGVALQGRRRQRDGAGRRGLARGDSSPVLLLLVVLLERELLHRAGRRDA